MDDIKKPKVKRAHIAPLQRRNYAHGASALNFYAVPKKASYIPTPNVDNSSKEILKSKRRKIHLRASFLRPVRTLFQNAELQNIPSELRQLLPSRRKYPIIARIGWGILAALMIATTGMEIVRNRQESVVYALSPQAQSLVGKPSSLLAQSLRLDNKTLTYNYNQGYQPALNTGGQISGPKFTGVFPVDPTQGTSVTDPVNNITIKFIPKFNLKSPIQDQNRLIYPITGSSAQKVYTFKASGLKEDIVLNKYHTDTTTYDYKLELPDGTEARMESNGSLAVYGVNSTLLGNVTTATEQDAALLQKARKNGEKNKLLFTFPAPFVKEAGKRSSSARAWFSLKDNILTLHASGLKGASYPLTIDPSVYIETAVKFMRGNNESNIDFDTTNELIQKSPTTGARIDYWSDSTEMSTGVWDQAMASAGGYVYRAGGRSDPTMPYIAGQQATVKNPAGTSFTVNMPTVRPAGDLYLAVIARKGTTTVTAPSGGNWIVYANTREHVAYYKIGEDKGSGNEAASYTWTTTASVEWTGVILRVKNFNTGAPISGTAGTGSGATNAVPVFPATTPAQDATLVIRAVAIDEDRPTEATWLPLGHTRVYSGSSSSATTNVGLAVAYLDTPPLASVSTGTASFVSDGILNDTYGASSIAIRPATTTTIGPLDTVEWAQFNSSTGEIDSPNPGNGVCTGWCSSTSTTYKLPSARVGMTMYAYNGFLYAVGGSTDGTAANAQNTVWIAKLGANGEPQLWHPSGGTPVYWYASTNVLPVSLSYSSIIAYNNKLYLLGGRDTSGASVATVRSADLLPTGDISAWTTTGTQNLPDARHSHSVQVYNDVLYLIGGNSNGTLRNTVYYSKLNSSGTMNAWTQTNAFSNARASFGGSMSSLWGAYIYLAGGCTALTGSYCSTIASDVQLASINADGSLAEWNPILNLSNQRIGYSFVAWQNGLYRFGGCNRQNTTTGACYVVPRAVEYGIINPDGDASTVSNSVAAGTGVCSGASPTDCNLPAPGDGTEQAGQMSSMVVINNGYIYVIGGCTNVNSPAVTNECTSGANTAAMSGNTAYAAIDSSGNIVRAATCGGTYVTNSSWCVDSTNRINGTTGIGAAGVTVFNNTVYVIGGTNGSSWSNVVYRVGLSSDGSLAGAWDNSQTLTNLNLTSTADDERGYLYTFTRANPNAAATNPGNLYILGGCRMANVTDDGIGCQNYYTEVIKCNIATDGSLNTCGTGGQMQIDADGDAGNGNQGLALMAGTVYANRLYLIGGACTQVGNATDPCGSTYSGNRKDTIYAKIDDSNNIVDNTTGSSTGAWAFTTGQMSPVRRRAVAFGYNGYIYSLAGYSGSSSLQDLLFAKIDVSTGDMGDFDSSGVVVTPRWDLRAAVGNGYVYAIGGCAAGAAPSGCTGMQPQVQTFQLYNNDSGAPASYTSVSDDTFAVDTDRWGASSAILNGYIYVAGGCISTTDCTNATNSVQYAPISAADGGIGTWVSATNNLPADRTWGKLEVVGGTLYYLGGQDDTATNEQSTIYYVSTFTNGDITAAWSTASGGIGDTASQVAQARTKFGSAVWNNRIYIVGGLDGSGANTNTVYISPQLNSGGNIAADSWTSDTDVIDVARRGNTVVAYANNLYSIGGTNGTQYFNDSQFAQINSDGTLGTWTFSTALPSGVSEAEGFAANGYLYVIGGRSAATSCAPNTLVTPISANTTIASGNKPTGIGEWYETNMRYVGGRYGATVAYDKGRTYILGGGCTSPIGPNYTTGTISQTGTTVTGSGTSWTDNLIGGIITYSDTTTATITNVVSSNSLRVSVSKTVAGGSTYSISVRRHNMATLKSQPQIAKYSRLIDTDVDVFPTKWLMNGLDNSIGARWQMRYRSMNDIDGIPGDCGTADMTTWGTETNYGDVSLGTPAPYVVRDGSNNNILCGRYFYFSASIDSSQAFGYPEDVNRGPVIWDLSLFYTADPSKRLIHGKTFTGGQQQPLDTPIP